LIILRFGGAEFPPRVFYKVFMRKEGVVGSVKYFSGKEIINTATPV
jgi:hypothetical protein